MAQGEALVRAPPCGPIDTHIEHDITTAAVRENQGQVWDPVTVDTAKHIESLPLQSVLLSAAIHTKAWIRTLESAQ